jgi:hypothetical protein
MASQREDQDLKMRNMWIAIDPGERWCGYATLRYFRKEWRADTGVFDTGEHPFPELVNALLFDTYRSYVVVESFQARKSYINLDTVKLIGALKYAALSRESQFAEVRAGDPDKEIPLLGLGTLVAIWAKKWPFMTNNSRWHHARSAWRIMGQWLLQHNQRVFHHLISIDQTDLKIAKRPMNIEIHRPGDLHAPTMHWEQILGSQLKLI